MLTSIQVLWFRKCSQFALTIIYAEVAQRLDVEMEILSSRNADDDGNDDVILRWMEFPE